MLLTGGSALTSAPATAATSYKNCAAMNKDYPHGVGKPRAVDRTTRTPVTDFTVDADLYKANTKRDRDRDGIACEKA
ncbi:excalibur calcium-binding domain-containing protein [Gordonia sp. (in: high G+C Gram-positive bacteria)]|uniref:excalibur calcium-binding domain-containing protein n=1 Tax=Gordonia sp. (in: high G+C Gram-positive bacteria) TaxID=84139 RepID=UPI0025BA6F4A|nr:excalibur calcium-binding domain-containing protein [Gordonia sp. (in: high G+C Gram-positive bacteria)]HMS74297.1 excalibur calcium-binding domain-containing protein [Gordonia sp. (in: high G+C Gram-positive bacteria)]HQV18361.1 excalibur calcium-binding domain-containing protein [Gordonia sp. (in: high G+C Gram-positive bacteria)]